MPNLFKICFVLSNLIHADRYKYIMLFLTLNFRRVLHVVCFLATQTILKFSHSSPTSLRRWNRQSVPKRRHIKFRRRGITQKKTYNNIMFSLHALRKIASQCCIISKNSTLLRVTITHIELFPLPSHVTLHRT